MNYQKIYQSIISNAQTRLIDENTYYEKHHILPKCMGGTNESTNLVKLTYREHFVAHWLLHNIHPDNKRLHYAFNFMAYSKWYVKSHETIVSSRILEKRKIELVKTFSSEEHKEKVRYGWAKSNRKLNNIINIEEPILPVKKTKHVKFINVNVINIKKEYNDELSEYLNFIKEDRNVKYVY